jgi:hypothetical protein
MFGALYYPLFPGIFALALKATALKKLKIWKLGPKKKLILIASMFTFLALKGFLKFLIFTLFKIRFFTV